MDRTPQLRDFPDHIITRQIQREDGDWKACLDVGMVMLASDPDFLTYTEGDTRERSAARCAESIRENVRNPGPRGTHSCLTDYDLELRLFPYWSKKLRLEELGLDANEIANRAHWSPEAGWNLHLVPQPNEYTGDRKSVV